MATWKIIDGSLPFLDEFPTMYEIDGGPISLWMIRDGNLPFKFAFPQMYEYVPFDPSGTSNVYVGDINVSSIYLGDNPVSKIYLGDQEIYS